MSEPEHDEGHLTQSMKAYIAARLVGAIDLYFPHPIPERRV